MISPVIENWDCDKTKKALDTYLQYKLFRNRFDSFENVETVVDRDIQEDIIEAGFYFNQEFKAVVCFACGLQVSENCASSNIVDIHKNFSPDCPIIKERDVSCNILSWDGTANPNFYGIPKAKIELDYSAELTLRASRIEKHNDLYSQQYLASLVINPEKVYQLFQMRINRQFSFRNAPISQRGKNWLVENGFFWTKHNRIVQCAFCRVAIESKRLTLPVFAHKEFSPNCPFINGEKYDIEGSFCSICLVRPPKILYYPCRHLCSCVDCDFKLAGRKKLEEQKCPICRGTPSVKIYCIAP